MKKKIEKEIEKINNIYEKTINDLTKSFQIKHEKLNKEEKDLKLKLQEEVKKIKLQLENFLLQSNNKIKINDQINQRVNILKNEEKNINKTLQYISKINKNEKDINKLLQELMKNIKFRFKEEETNIYYEQYYFNGIPIPKEIEFKDISYNNVNLYWKIENMNNIYIDNNKIRYKIEMRKDFGKFNQIYEGNNLNYSVNGLEMDSDYEFRICLLYDNVNGPWTDVYLIKTPVKITYNNRRIFLLKNIIKHLQKSSFIRFYKIN